MKRIFILSFFALSAVVGLVGCFPEESEKALIYDGPTVLEFKNYTLGQLATALNAKGVFSTAAQTDSSRTVLLNTRGTDTVLVQLVGPQSSSPIDVSFTVRTTSATTTAVAVEGTHYNFIPAGTRKVTIPANSSKALILISMIPGSLPTVGDQRVIGIDLASTGTVKPNPNFDSFFVTLRR